MKNRRSRRLLKCPLSVSHLPSRCQSQANATQPSEETPDASPEEPAAEKGSSAENEPSDDKADDPAPAVETKEVVEEEQPEPKEDAVESPAVDDKLADEAPVPPPAPPVTEEAKSAEEKEESKDTVGPIPGVVKSEAKTGEIHHPIPPDTPVFSAQDLGESISHFVSGSGIGVSGGTIPGVSEAGGDTSMDTGRSLDVDTVREVGTGLTDGNWPQIGHEEAGEAAVEKRESTEIEVREAESAAAESVVEVSEKVVLAAEINEEEHEAAAPETGDAISVEVAPMTQMSQSDPEESDAPQGDDGVPQDEPVEARDAAVEGELVQEEAGVEDKALFAAEREAQRGDAEKNEEEGHDLAGKDIEILTSNKEELVVGPAHGALPEGDVKEGADDPITVELAVESHDASGPSAIEVETGKCSACPLKNSSMDERQLRRSCLSNHR
jgi:hypothetical protein